MMKIMIFIYLVIRLAFFFAFSFLIVPLAHAEISANLLKSAKTGDANAQYSIARSYELGKRIKSDKKKAIEWYSKAADQGHSEAGYRLGLIYYTGIGGFKINLNKAFHYISLAAKANHKRSQAHLAKMYENGDGVKRNEVLSDYWYEQAFYSETQSLFEYQKKQKNNTVEEKHVVINKSKNKTKTTAPTVSSGYIELSFPDSILSRNWIQNNKPAIYFQSSETKCKPKQASLVCMSSKLKGFNNAGLYKYKLKSIITRGANDKEINIIYRKLYTSVPEETIEAYAEEAAADQTKLLTTGWEKKTHSVSCRFENSKAVLCRPVAEDAFYIKSSH